MNTKTLLCAGFAGVLIFSGCAEMGEAGGKPADVSAQTYTRSAALGVSSVLEATVVSSRPVKIESGPTAPQVGTATGVAVGGVAGSAIGNGKVSLLSSIVGAIAGGVAGHAIGNAVGNTDGQEIVVRMAGTRMLQSIVQAGKEVFTPGQAVFVITGNGTARVTAAGSEGQASPTALKKLGG